MRNKIIPYNPKLKEYARQLRKNSTLAETLLWQNIKNRSLGVQFHRQVPMLEYIVDFYCHELQLAIEIDGSSHEFKYESDVKRQGLLEKQGVEFVRFSDNDVKTNMFSVGLALEEKVRKLLEIRVPNNTPLTPPSMGAEIDDISGKAAPTPLKSRQGDNSYGKKEKLKSKKLIDRLFAEGRSVSSYPIKLIYLKTALPKEVPIQAGVAVPKKNFKSAVKRNRIKRLLREGYRLNKHLVFNNSEASFAFLFLYLGKEVPAYLEIKKAMNGVLRKFVSTEAEKKKEERKKKKD